MLHGALKTRDEESPGNLYSIAAYIPLMSLDALLATAASPTLRRFGRHYRGYDEQKDC